MIVNLFSIWRFIVSVAKTCEKGDKVRVGVYQSYIFRPVTSRRDWTSGVLIAPLWPARTGRWLVVLIALDCSRLTVELSNCRRLAQKETWERCVQFNVSCISRFLDARAKGIIKFIVSHLGCKLARTCYTPGSFVFHFFHVCGRYGRIRTSPNKWVWFA